MAIRMNTTSLGMGMPRMTGRQMTDPLANMISKEIGKANYRKSFRSNYKVAELRKYVMKMIQSWSPQDKMAVLSQYGDPRKGMSDGALVEALITNLKESDLEILLKDIKMDELRLGTKIRGIRRNQKMMGSRFNTGTFEEAFSQVRYARNPAQYKKAMNAYDKSIKVPRYVRNKYGALKREVITVLKDLFTRVELTGLAMEMGIELNEGTNKNEVMTFISNKILLYVDLIMGKGKDSYASAFLDPKPYNEVLQYTTYSWITGKPGMSGDNMSTLRSAAKQAKYEMRFRQRDVFTQKEKSLKIGKRGPMDYGIRGIQKVLGVPGAIIRMLGGEMPDGGKIPGIGSNFNPLRLIPGLLGGLGGGIFGGLKYIASGGNQGGMLSGARQGFESGSNSVARLGDFLKNPFNYKTRRLEERAIQMVNADEAAAGTDGIRDDLSGMDPQALFREGQKYGLKPTKNLNTLRREIRIQRRKEDAELEQLNQKSEKFTAQGKLLSESDAARREFLAKKGAPDTSKEGQLLPYIRYLGKDRDGKELISRANYAVQVHVMNQLTGSSIAEAVKGSGGGMLDKEKMTEWLGSRYSSLSATEAGISEFDKIKTSLSDAKAKMEKDSATGMEMSAGRQYAMNSNSDIFPGFKGDPKDPFVAVLDNSNNSGRSATNQAMTTKKTMALRVFDMSSIILAKRQEELEKKNKGKTVGTDFLSETSNMLGVKMVRKEPAMPVFVTNKSVRTDVGSILIEGISMLVRALTIATDPLGVTAGAVKDSLSAIADQTGGVSELIKLAGFATGGIGRQGGMSNKTTHFIVGDSLSKRPNPEQVAIDWKSKSYSVKPVPTLDAAKSVSGNGQSDSGQFSRMTSSERGQPLSVGISSHLITYDRSLQGANDKGDKQALKVYAVNPGITDLVDINGSNVSLIGLVADMTTRLASIEGLLSINNQQNQAVIAATTATSRNVSKMGSSSGRSLNPFASGGFPSELDEILTGS